LNRKKGRGNAKWGKKEPWTDQEGEAGKKDISSRILLCKEKRTGSEINESIFGGGGNVVKYSRGKSRIKVQNEAAREGAKNQQEHKIQIFPGRGRRNSQAPKATQKKKHRG